MIVFIDESYERDSQGVWHYALAGFGINEFRYRALQAAVYQLCQRVFDVKSNYEGDNWRLVLDQRIITEKPVSEIELKGASLLTEGKLRRFGGEESPHYRLVSETFKCVKACRGTSIGILMNPEHPDEVKDCRDGCPRAYRELLEVIAQWMEEQYPRQPATLVMDTEHNGVNLPLSRAIATYLYRSEFGGKNKHLFPSPFWVDSQSMVGSQVADLIAHVLMNSMKPESEQK